MTDLGDQREHYVLTRFLFLRFLGLVYFVAFLSLAQQLGPLIGSHGLLPAQPYLNSVAAGSRFAAAFELPTIFWLNCSDTFLATCSYVGLALSLQVLFGFANVPLLAALWILYMSFVHVGQLWYGYGWEILLLETGFLAIFLCPLLDPRPTAGSEPPRVTMWLLRWLLFRVMLGAGLIKLRGDPCWRDLTCMLYHYETQPLPNPLSWYLHQLPAAFHTFEVLFNHFVELVVPWTLFAPRRLRHIGGLFLVAFQITLIISGNLSFLNWLTLAICIPCFDDQALRDCLPRRLRDRLLQFAGRPASPLRQTVAYALAALVLYLSIAPVLNLLGSRQVMNGSFDRLHLVNTYGAFGSVGRLRNEVILQGSPDGTNWREYEFKCKPGNVNRPPCFIAPYQLRIDWQIWFAAMEDPGSNPWLIHLIAQLLHNDRGALSLLANNPFPDEPPKVIRTELYEYHFTRRGDATHAWWTRQRVDQYLPPLALDNPALQRFLESRGWNQPASEPTGSDPTGSGP